MYIIRLTDQQLQSLAGLLDAGVRGVGLRAVKDAAELMTIIENPEKERKTENEDASNVYTASKS